MTSLTEITVGEVLRWIDEGRRFLLLDVRNRDEVERWRLEGRTTPETACIPYFEFLEDPDGCTARVPRDRGEIVVLCAKGGGSALVADVLRERGIEARSVSGGMIAYGAWLQTVRVPLGAAADERWELWQLNRRGKGCLSYVIRAGDEAVVVDPSRDIEAYERFAASLGARIVRVLDTHVHADHVSGGPRLAERHGAPYFVTAGPGVEVKQPTTPLRDDEQLRLGGAGGVTIATRVVATPGHTPGSTSYLVDGRFLLSGDTLFVSGVGRPDLGGQVVAWGKALFHTLRERITALPDDVVVLPSHYGSPAEMDDDGVVGERLGVLRGRSPELAIDDEDEFVELMRAGVREPPAAYHDIVRVNLGLATADDVQAGEWEIGKNECAAGKLAAHATGAGPLPAPVLTQHGAQG